MSKYRKIDPRMWNDSKFRALSDAGKLVFMLVLTHPHMTSLGAMRATLDGLAAELRWSPKAFREAFNEASSQGLLKVDEEACFVCAPKFLKYNGPESPNVVKSWAASLEMLPECDVKTSLILTVVEQLKGLGEAFQEALPKGFGEALAKAMPNQEQEQDPKHKHDLFLSSTAVGGESVKKNLSSKESHKPPETRPQDVIDAWNSSAATKKVRDLTIERIAKLKTRLAVQQWPWREAIAKLPIPNRGEFTWQPDIDWFIENGTNAVKLVEGKYDHREHAKINSNSPNESDLIAAASGGSR